MATGVIKALYGFLHLTELFSARMKKEAEDASLPTLLSSAPSTLPLPCQRRENCHFITVIRQVTVCASGLGYCTV